MSDTPRYRRGCRKLLVAVSDTRTERRTNDGEVLCWAGEGEVNGMVTRTVEVDGKDSNPDCERRTNEDQGGVVAVVGCSVEVERRGRM